ncbi:MAG: hypothetical protein LH629_16780 [Ignavibacteria bacterium]|nr:hypothetical protein [Ignavibacteria bacterium]
MKSNTHIPYFITFGLVLSFIFSLTGSFFPSESNIQTILFKIDALFAITAFTCLAAKSSSEKFDLPAAGFTVLAIAQGLFLAEISQADNWDYSSQSTGVLFMIPSVIMISYYEIFPKWLRIGGIISVIPFVILFIVRLNSGIENTTIFEIIIFLFYQTVTLCWAWQIWKQRNLR